MEKHKKKSKLIFVTGSIVIILITFLLFIFLKVPQVDIDIIEEEIVDLDTVYLNTDIELQTIEIIKEEKINSKERMLYLSTESTGNNMRYIGAYVIKCSLYKDKKWHIDEWDYNFDKICFIPDRNNYDYAGTWMNARGLTIFFSEVDFEKKQLTYGDYVGGNITNAKLEAYINNSSFGMHTTTGEDFRFEYTNNNNFIDDYFSMYFQGKEYVKISEQNTWVPQLQYSTNLVSEEYRKGFWPFEKENIFKIVADNGEVVLSGMDLMYVSSGTYTGGVNIQIDFEYDLEETLSNYCNQTLEVIYGGEVIKTIQFQKEEISPFYSFFIGTEDGLNNSEILALTNALEMMCYESE